MSVGVLVGAGDVGLEAASLLLETVEHIVALDRDDERLDRLGNLVGPLVSSIAGDITQGSARVALIDQVVRINEPISWVILTAGMGLCGKLVEVAEEQIRTVFETNVVSPILLLRALLDGCAWEEGARIVGLGSISARRSLPDRTVYGASKAALEAFLTALGAEVASRQIIVNVVSAGVIDTNFIAKARDSLVDWGGTRVPAARLGETAEVAAVMAYLATEAPRYLTCSRVVIDGGSEALA
jgi:NAD(P)-dependent dehydrogenase (short-subunit alcohol dehydrogenase family)